MIPTTHDVALRYDDQSVVASVRNLLLTNFYERPFQPNVGSNINRLLFEQATPLTAKIISDDITNTIKNYEPRVKINDLQVTLNSDLNSFNVYLSVYIGNNTLPTNISLILQRSR
jgi:phage baseplate assembly protein W